jgi:peptide/nickel transport system substrate-binding protein
VRARHVLSIALAGVVVTTGLTACSSGSSGTAGNGKKVATVLNVGMPNGTQTENNNPYVPTSASNSLGYRWQIYEPLLMWNPVKPADKAKPWLASNAVWTPDYKSVTVTARDNATWSDGQKFTAADIAFTYNLLKSNDAMNQYATPFDTITTSGNDVTITFKSPQYVNQVKILSLIPILPEHIWKDIPDPVKDLDKNPIGTGPFTLKTFTPQTVTLDARTSGYWQAAPAVKELRYTSYTDNNAQTTALANGSSEWSFAFIPNVKAVFEAKDPAHYKVWAPPVLGIHGLFINTTKKPFDNPVLRQAMSMAINRDDIFNQAESGYFHPLVTSVTGLPTPAGDAFLAPEYKGKTQTVDVAGAKKLLTDAGFTYAGDTLKDPSGKAVSLTLTDPSGWSDYQTSLTIVSDNLKQIGIDAKVDKANEAAWTKNVTEGNFDAAFHWTNGGATPYDIYQTIMDGALLKPIGTASPQGNYGRFDNKEATTALKAYADATSDADRTTAMNTVQKIFVDQMPMIPVGADNVGADYSTKNWVGWPTDADPYAALQPTQPNSVDVVLHLKPASS